MTSASETSVFVDLEGRLAQFQHAPTQEYWESTWDGISDEQLRQTLRHTTRLGSHGRFFRRHLPAGARILEAGCGTGIWVRRLQSSGYRVLGLDYARRTLERAKSIAPGLELAGGDLRRLPLADGSIQAHVSFGVLEHSVDGPGPLLSEARRVLARDGVLLASVPQRNRLRERVPTLSRSEAESRGYAFHQYYYSFDDLARVLRGCGFEVLPDPHYYSVHSGLSDAVPAYRRVISSLPPLARAASLLDFIPGVAKRWGHMMFVAARPA